MESLDTPFGVLRFACSLGVGLCRSAGFREVRLMPAHFTACIQADLRLGRATGWHAVSFVERWSCYKVTMDTEKRRRSRRFNQADSLGRHLLLARPLGTPR
jgi:hypothetical protein